MTSSASSTSFLLFCLLLTSLIGYGAPWELNETRVPDRDLLLKGISTELHDVYYVSLSGYPGAYALWPVAFKSMDAFNRFERGAAGQKAKSTDNLRRGLRLVYAAKRPWLGSIAVYANLDKDTVHEEAFDYFQEPVVEIEGHDRFFLVVPQFDPYEQLMKAMADSEKELEGSLKKHMPHLSVPKDVPLARGCRGPVHKLCRIEGPEIYNRR